MYKVIECEQGTPEWHKARAGIITASNFDKIISPTGKQSTQVDKYVFELLADCLAGEKASGGFVGNHFTDRGNELEPEAREMYAALKGVEVQQVGFCIADDGYYGCSPDGLVGDDGLLEIKCPAPHTHAKYLYDNAVDMGYYPQIQGQMLVTGRKWCDFISYHPDMPPFIVRVMRDEVYIANMRRYLNEARLLLDEKKAKLKQLGYL